MNIVDPQVILETEIKTDAIMKQLELIGRVCYKSEGKIATDSANKFIENIIKSGHESVIEHISVTFRIICDRGVSHEMVRHRIASYSQESTRYCNYSKNNFGNEITVIAPCFWNKESEQFKIWKDLCEASEKAYFNLLESGAKPEEARDVLPISLKTELVVTMNLREWRHFLKTRTSVNAHPQMKQIALLIGGALKEKLPVIFSDIELN